MDEHELAQVEIHQHGHTVNVFFQHKVSVPFPAARQKLNEPFPGPLWV